MTSPKVVRYSWLLPLGSAAGVGMRGSISARVAELYTNHASIMELCITSSLYTRSSVSALEWWVRVRYSNPSCWKPMPLRPIHEKGAVPVGLHVLNARCERRCTQSSDFKESSGLTSSKNSCPPAQLSGWSLG
jgi:hypothetical protein